MSTRVTEHEYRIRYEALTQAIPFSEEQLQRVKELSDLAVEIAATSRHRLSDAAEGICQLLRATRPKELPEREAMEIPDEDIQRLLEDARNVIQTIEWLFSRAVSPVSGREEKA